MIVLDVVENLPISNDSKFYFFAIVDYFSGYLEAILVRETFSRTIIYGLQEYLGRFGIPKIILTDNGLSFFSYEFDNFFKQPKIQHRHTSIYFAQSNGLERIHKTTRESLAAICNKTHK